MAEMTKSTEAKKDEMQVEKEKLESVKKADAAVKTMHDFTSPEILYKELINSVLKYHPSTDIRCAAGREVYFKGEEKKLLSVVDSIFASGYLTEGGHADSIS